MMTSKSNIFMNVSNKRAPIMTNKYQEISQLIKLNYFFKELTVYTWVIAYCMNVSRIHEQIIREKFRIRETKKLSTNADCSTDTTKILLVRQNLHPLQEKVFFLIGDHCSPLLFSKEGGKKVVKRNEKVWRKKTHKQTNIQTFQLIKRTSLKTLCLWTSFRKYIFLQFLACSPLKKLSYYRDIVQL